MRFWLPSMLKTCETCGEDFTTDKRSRRFCSRDCHYKTMRGKPSWNAGRGEGWTDARGYRWVYVNESGQRRARREHRVLMEQELGRPLRVGEDVHHINGDRTDNRLENLRLLPHGEHSTLHNLAREYKRGYTLNLSDEERTARAGRMREVRRA